MSRHGSLTSDGEVIVRPIERSRHFWGDIGKNESWGILDDCSRGKTSNPSVSVVCKYPRVTRMSSVAPNTTYSMF